MIYLSELYGRIGEILHQYGDMKVSRFQDMGLDGMVTNRNVFKEYSNIDFFVFQSNIINSENQIINSTNRFIINPYGEI